MDILERINPNEKKPFLYYGGKTRWKGLGKIFLGAGALAAMSLGAIHVCDETRHVSYNNSIIRQIDYTAKDAKNTADKAIETVNEEKDDTDKPTGTGTHKKTVVHKPIVPKKPVKKLDDLAKETGGRVAKQEHGGLGGGPIQVENVNETRQRLLESVQKIVGEDEPETEGDLAHGAHQC